MLRVRLVKGDIFVRKQKLTEEERVRLTTKDTRVRGLYRESKQSTQYAAGLLTTLPLQTLRDT